MVSGFLNTQGVFLVESQTPVLQVLVARIFSAEQ